MIFTIILSFILVSCTDNPVVNDTPLADPNAVDYSKAEHWLTLPSSINKEVDVFYLYPTAWQKIEGDSNICTIDNASMLKLSRLAFNRQATAFETVANIYAPYYRQIDLFYRMSLSLEEGEKAIAGIPTKDATAAFDYYIKNYNNGRPFILAGHSQGSNVLKYILSIYMKEYPEVYARMVAAYVIGYSVTSDFLTKNPHLVFADGPDDTGVIISYNTESPEVVAGTNFVVIPGGIVINPITWTKGETIATAGENLGSIILNKDGTIAEGIPTPVMNFADALVDIAKGVIICSTVDVNKWAPGNSGMAKGVFHSFDYPFYYYNLRENAANRVRKFLSK